MQQENRKQHLFCLADDSPNSILQAATDCTNFELSPLAVISQLSVLCGNTAALCLCLLCCFNLHFQNLLKV